MSRSRYFSPRLGLVMFAAFGLASIGSPLRAQSRDGRRMPSSSRSRWPRASISATSTGRPRSPFVLDESSKDAELVDAHVIGGNMAAQGIKLVDGKLVGVPVGGPYTINCSVKVGPGSGTINDRRPGIRGRPLGAGGPVQHAGGRRPDRRHAAQSPGHAAGDGRQMGAGRGAAALAGRLARPGPLGRSQDPRRPVGRGTQDADERSRPGLAVRRRRWSSRPGFRSA